MSTKAGEHIKLSGVNGEDKVKLAECPSFDASNASVEDKKQQWRYYFNEHTEEVKNVLEGKEKVLCVDISWIQKYMPAFEAGMMFSGATKRTYTNVANRTLREQPFKELALSQDAYIRFKGDKDIDEIAKVAREEELKSGISLLLSPEPLLKINQDIDKRICKDNILKNVVFMTGLSAYGQNPLNLFLEGPSSTGKTYVVTETLKYFPKEDIWYLGGLSPTALVHDRGKDEERNGETFKVVDLSEKILVFLEKPNLATLTRLLPILSHDVDEIEYRITDKNSKGQHTTRKVLMQGFPAVIFCTTKSETLQDLSTRNLLYAPEVTKEKITKVIKLQKNAATKPWEAQTTEDTFKSQVQEAIKEIKKNFSAAEVAIPEIKAIDMVVSTDPRIMRDYKKMLELIKSCARLHAHQRLSIEYQKDDIGHKVILANFFDVLVGLTLYDEIELSTVTGLAPIVIEFFKNVLQPLRDDKTLFNYTEIQEKHFEVFKRVIGSDTLRKHRIDPLENAGYVTSDFDEHDKRKRYFTISRDIPTPQITGEKRRFEIGDIKEFERGEIWIKNASKIEDVEWYMYRGNLNKVNLSDFRGETDFIHGYLYTPLAVRYYEGLFPQFNKLTKSEISGIFKSPVNADNSGIEPTEKDALEGEQSQEKNDKISTESGDDGKKESPVNAGNLKNKEKTTIEELKNAELRSGISKGEDVVYERYVNNKKCEPGAQKLISKCLPEAKK